MQSNIRLGHIWGIPIGLSFSWFLIFGLVTWSLATGFFPVALPGISTAGYAALGLVTSLLFFASVVAHELGHAFVALRNGVPVRAITLHLLGGLAQIGREPANAGAEFRIAIAGPLVSLALAAGFGLLSLADLADPMLGPAAAWLARINLILFLFNLIPGFPLDGGRVLRAIVWKLTGNSYRATRVAAVAGQAVAFSFIGIGVYNLFTGASSNGLWLIFIGWFLQSAASSSYAQAGLEQELAGITAEQVMQRERVEISGAVTVEQLAGPLALGQEQRSYFVGDADEIRGMLTAADIARVPRSLWAFTRAEQIMTPIQRLVGVQAQTGLLEALQQMEEAQVGQAPVLAEGRVVGLLSRDQVLRFIRLRRKLAV